MHGTGAVGLNGQTVYAYFMEFENRIRLRISADENERLGMVEGLRVDVAFPGQERSNHLILTTSHTPPFVWLDLEPIGLPSALRVG